MKKSEVCNHISAMCATALNMVSDRENMGMPEIGGNVENAVYDVIDKIMELKKAVDALKYAEDGNEE